MPQILIRERDETTAARLPSANFSVVVPGLVATASTASFDTVSDENNVYEVSKISDFKEYVGIVPKQDATETKEREFATATTDAAAKTGYLYDSRNEGVGKLGEPTSDTAQDIAKAASQFYNLRATGTLYKATRLSTTPAENVGHLIVKVTRDGGTDYFSLALVEPDDDLNFSTLENDNYAVVTKEHVGQDAAVGIKIAHMGNQIAYELIANGYTVLYKKIDSVLDLADEDWWKPLKDKSLYNFRYIVSGILNETTTETTQLPAIYKHMRDVASGDYEQPSFDPSEIEGRGDCTALLDIRKSTYTSTAGASFNTTTVIDSIKAEASTVDSEYASWFAPTVKYKTSVPRSSVVSGYNDNSEFPATVHYLLCEASSLPKYPEWFAVSGYTRGESPYAIESVGYNFGEHAIRKLQPRVADSGDNNVSVNVIMKDSNGYFLWGNRTAKKLTANGLVASHFLNIRQLCSTIKKRIYEVCRLLTFDPNSDLLWLNFCNSVSPLLETMKAQQGIRDYKFQKLETKQKAKLYAALRIVPIEAVEDFEIILNLEDNLDNPELTEVPAEKI